MELTLFEKPIVIQTKQETCHLVKNMLHCYIHNIPPPKPVLSRWNCTPPSSFTEILYNIVTPQARSLCSLALPNKKSIRHSFFKKSQFNLIKSSGSQVKHKHYAFCHSIYKCSVIPKNSHSFLLQEQVHFSVQCSPISKRSLIFGTFPGLACLSFW
jgi:hypothetical protein